MRAGNLTMILQLHDALDDGREMFIFQELHFSGKRIGAVAGFDRDARLKNRFTMVILLIYVVDRDPRLLVRCRDDRFVHEPAVHPFSAVFWQQRGMDIDDPARISPDQRFGDLPKKSCQDDIVDLPLPQLRHIGRPPEKRLFFDQEGRDAFRGGDGQYARPRFVAPDQTDRDILMIFEVIDDVFGISSRSGSKDRETCHTQNYGGQGNCK